MYNLGGKKTFVFDIETIPRRLSDFSIRRQEYLLKFEGDSSEGREKVQQQMALWSLTNEIVAISVQCVETMQGAVYFQTRGITFDFQENGIRYQSGDERAILGSFWRVMDSCGRFVTFNGRQFDCPVLMLRSAMLGVKPSRNLVTYRYKTDVHVDLLEQMTFYGATRRFTLDMFCESFGIDSPKDGMIGHDVLPYFEDGRFEDIARYCVGDVRATSELFLKWDKYLSF